jgi:hypothetical protein
MFATLLHALVGVSGLALLYAALFLKETEEGQIQNRLENLWVDIDDLSRAALSKQTAFLQQVSAMANSALNKLFGARLFAARAVSASLCFSLGSALLILLSMGEWIGLVINPKLQVYALIFGIVSFLIGLLPTPYRYFGFLWVSGFMILVLHGDWQMPHAESWLHFLMKESLPFFVVLVGGFISDILFIALSRWCLRKSSQLKNGWKIASLLSLNGCIGLTLISPVILQTLIVIRRNYMEHRMDSLLLFLGASNLVGGAISFLFVALAFASLLHLVIWPILEKPIYSLQRYGVARNPKLLASTSATCLGLAWPHSPIIQFIIKLIRGH